MTNVRTVGEEIEACLPRAVGCALERKTGQQLGAEGIESWKKKGFTERVLEGSQKKKSRESQGVFQREESHFFSVTGLPFFYHRAVDFFSSPDCYSFSSPGY